MIDFNKIRTFPIKNRKNKFSIKEAIPVNNKIFVQNHQLESLADKISKARQDKKQIIFMMGAHPIKVGCSLLLIDLIKKGFITHLAVNGAFAIHDFEIALIGETSEYVEETIQDGSFGMAEETGKFLNDAAKEAAILEIGYGESIARKIKKNNLEYKRYSVIYNAYKKKIPITVHTAIGAEVIYQHPSCDGASLGKSSYQDFKIFVESVSKLEGGVVLNIGSAVIMPEVFLKALSIVRNLGFPVKKFTSANLDMIEHYRPIMNVVKRPTSSGGTGYSIIERHERSIPTLHKLLLNN